MPLVPPNVAYGRVGGSWRAWETPYVRQGGAWVVPKYVWAYHDDTWRVVWAGTATAPVSVTATIVGAGVEVSWTAPAGGPSDPEVATSYNVRRDDGTLVGSVPVGGVYLVTDPSPIAGDYPYTVEALIDGVVYESAVSNSVDVAPAPTGASASTVNVGADTNVVLTWSASPGAATYRIANIGGAFVADTAALTFTDTNPLPGVGGYTITALTAGFEPGGTSTTNTLSLAQAPTGLTLVPDFLLTWTNPVGDYDDVQVLVNGAVEYTLTAGTTSQLIDPEFEDNAGTVLAITVRTRVSGNSGPQSAVLSEPSEANVPVAVSAVSTGVVGQLKLTWGNPAGSYTGYQVQRDNGGWADVGDNVSPSYYTWTGSSGSRSMRVRTLSAGGASDYVTRSATPLWDNSPPALPTITSWKPESSYGRMVFRFTTSASDNSQYEVNFRIDGGGWNFANVWTGVGNSSSVARVLTTVPNDPGGYTVEARVRVRDQYQNTSAWSSVWTYTTKESPAYITPYSSGHWRSGVFGQNTSNPTRPYQGYFSNASLNYQGFFYYGTNVATVLNASGTVGGKLTVTSMQFIAIREGGGNNVADCVYAGTHDLEFNPGFAAGSATISNLACIGTLTYGQSFQVNLTAQHQANLLAGAKGIGIQAPTGKPYMFLFDYTATFNGWIAVLHLG